MPERHKTCPQSQEQVIGMYFLEHRAKLLDIAAFLDRIDRAQPDVEASDFRHDAFKQAISLLIDGEPDRAKRILELLSDSSAELPQSAHGTKGASGAVAIAAG
ncbi:MAG: hypothetical protein KDB01_18430 [Planctomycetaceae bacterium]|nr:hypothetical protein [Planctomycetaceae bacterium]